MEFPLVSIIVPCYNHEKYIMFCIDSIMYQTFTDFELIVIDDGSKDGSPEILKRLKEKFGFTLILQQNRGLAATLNRGLKEFAKGKYATFCASDDFWALNKLALQIDFMEKNPRIPMCYGKAHYINEESKVIEEYDLYNNVLKGGWIFDEIFTFTLHPPVNYLYRRELFEEIGYYDAAIYAEDYYMNLKVAEKYKIGFIDEYLSYYRVDSSVDKIIRFDKVSDSHLISIDGYKDHPLYEKTKSEVYLRKLIWFSGFARHKKLALINLVKAKSLYYRKAFLLSVLKIFILWR